jgi:hypothetical protein
MSKSKGSKSEDTNREEYEANEEASECICNTVCVRV